MKKKYSKGDKVFFVDKNNGLIILSKKKYNILVSGASGFIGLMLIKELLKQDHNVYGLVRKNINNFNSKNYTNIFYYWHFRSST